MLQRDRDAIVDRRHTRRRPGLPCGFFFLRPGPHRALERHFAAVDFHGDVLCVALGRSDERILDFPLDVAGGDARLDDDQIADAFDSAQPADDSLGVLLLILPLDLAFQRDPRPIWRMLR